MSEPTIEHKPKKKRYEAIVDGEVAGYITYERIADALDLQHTVVEPAFEGRGVGSALARGVFEDLRAQGGLTAIPTCPFVARWLAKHAEYADLRHRPRTD
ncbi:MAG TPA: N-acetyltransferase [Propionibacterium sp.]|jgi:predicted GNAT family acetyltransferase|nr:N-acetyltransferase [Propionibacterium sp.]